MYPAILAQLVEQPPCKRQVVGSSPTDGSLSIKTAFRRFFVWTKRAKIVLEKS